MILYGTYLTYAVKEIFLKEEVSFSARELALIIQPNADECLVRRVRRALNDLEYDGFLQSAWQKVPERPHLSTKKYHKKDGEG